MSREVAIKKIEKELAEGNFSGKIGAVAPAVAKQLQHFCEESSVFAERVTDEEKTLAACCEAAVRDCGNAISDFEVYKRSVKYYMPEADIEFDIKIILPSSGRVLKLSLEKFI